MKHIILFSVFSILGIASLLGLALIPKEKISNPTSKTLSLASTTKQRKSLLSLMRIFPSTNGLKQPQMAPPLPLSISPTRLKILESMSLVKNQR